MKATWKNTVIAETAKENLIYIEGNWYFPPESVNQALLQPSDHRTMCHWKGEASYYNVVTDAGVNDEAAWYYPAPMAGSIERVGKDFTNYVAFWRGVTVSE